GLKFHPDLVLLMFYENDLTDNGLSYYPGFGPRPYVDSHDDHLQIVTKLDSSQYEKFILPLPFRMALNNHSYFYYFANSRIYQRIFAERMKKQQQDDLEKIETKTRFQIFYSVLNRLRQLLEEERIQLDVVLIPSREDVAQGRSATADSIMSYCGANHFQCMS